ncbi:MOSC domain-containing protein [Kaistia nematophila]|uniref:MOSC domain-containing protein n=1 Tax=Kaistia nematophila TaxID=2994654 RepID=A0A9X3E035_9HYPH|nr:MOSC domain-containing protein [Kaistia nematophila]MCX5568799.1 MOSC domain-containing protein [Kaistia nematophila]
MASIASLYRYPVKGFSAEALGGTALHPHRRFDADRIYAIENGPSGFDPAAPSYQPKAKFLCLMKNARLAGLETRFDPATHVWSIDGHGAPFAADLSDPAGRAATEAFLTGFMGDERRGPLKVLSAPGHAFTDVGKPYISFINLSSVAAVADLVGEDVDPLRFRANLYLDGLEPWQEFELVGREATLGGARVRFAKRTQRCAATNVNPATAARDLDIPGTLLRNLDHTDCGIYAEVIAGGDVAIGDTLHLHEIETG